MNKLVSILLFFSHLSLLAQTNDILNEIANYKLHETENKIKIIQINNEIDTNVYCRLIFNEPNSLQSDKKGIDEITSSLLIKGTQDITPVDFNKKLKKNNLNFNSGKNYIAVLSGNKNLDTIFHYFSDLLLNPGFDISEFNKIKQAKIKASFPPGISPRLYLRNKTSAALYGSKHPYGEVFNIKGLNKLKVEDCIEYYNNILLNTEKYLIVIGNIDFDSLTSKVEKYFNPLSLLNLLNNKYSKPKLPPYTKIYFHETEEKITGNQTYLSLMYPINTKFNNKEMYKIDLLNVIIGAFKSGKIDKKLRIEKEIAQYTFSELKSAYLSADFETTVVFEPDDLAEVVNTIIEQQKKLREKAVFKTELSIAKNYLTQKFLKYLNGFYDISEMLYTIEKNKLSKDYYKKYLDNIEKLDSTEMRKISKKYLRTDKYTIVVLGKNKEVRNELLKLAVKAETNTYKDNVITETIPYGFGAEDIIERFLRKVKADRNPKNQFILLKGKYGFDKDTNIIYRMIYRKGDMFKSKSSVWIDSASSILLKEEFYDGKDAVMITSKDSVINDSINYNCIKSRSYQFPEFEYKNKQIKIKLLGIFDIKKTTAYKIKVIYPYGKIRYDYYDTKTALKILSEDVEINGAEENIIQTVELSDYTVVDGTKGQMIAFKKNVIKNDYSINFEVISADFKSDIDKKEFKYLP